MALIPVKTPDGRQRANLNDILRSVRTHLGMEVSFISEFRDGRRIFRNVETAAGVDCIQVGGSDPLEESYCHWIAAGELPRLIQDPREHSISAAMPVTDRLPVGAHLSVPIRLRDGSVYGTFCCFSFEPDRSLTPRDLATMEAFAELAAEQIQANLEDERARAAKIQRIEAVLRDRQLEMVFQPAVNVTAGHMVFVEALARFPGSDEGPDAWFSAAAEVNLAEGLELLAVDMALDALDALPAPLAVSINVSPRTALSAALRERLERIAIDRVILEMTEHEDVDDYTGLIAALAPLRDQGMRLAIDDTGAGYASFRHVLELTPDIIKLDMSLSRGIDGDPAKRALASALISFAGEIGSDLVAEGVETQAELRTLQKLGATTIQGYLISRPVPLSDVHDCLRRFSVAIQEQN